MKGAVNRRVDNGGCFDAFLRALARWGSWASAKEDARMYARRRAAAFPRGTRIRITGACCAQDHKGKFARIHSYIDDADDYRITYEDEEPRSRNPVFDYHGYACVQGFDVNSYYTHSAGEAWFAARVDALKPSPIADPHGGGVR